MYIYYGQKVRDHPKIWVQFPKNWQKSGKLTDFNRTRGPKTSQKTWKWTSMEQKAFDKLKVTLCSLPILAYPNFILPFELHIVASMKGLGAVLYQNRKTTR